MCSGIQRNQLKGTMFALTGCFLPQVALVSWGTKLRCRRGGLVESDDSSRDFHINLFRVVPFLKSVLGNDAQDEYAPLRFLEG